MIITNEVVVTRKKSGERSKMYHSHDSGRVVFREKIGSLIGVRHPGIVLGVDKWNTKWVVHNHYENGGVHIVTFEEFSKGETVYYDDEIAVSYDRMTVVERAVDAWKRGEIYHWLKSNCQHFVKDTVAGIRESETVDKVSDAAMLGGSLMMLIGMFAGNKGLIQAGAVTAGVGLTGKAIGKQ